MELQQALNLFTQAGLISDEVRDNPAEALAELLQSKPTTVRQYLAEGTNLPSVDADRFLRAFSQLKAVSSPNKVSHAVRIFEPIDLSISYEVATGPLLAVRGDERGALLQILSVLDNLLNPEREANIPDSMKRKLREIYRSLTFFLSPSAEIDRSALGRLSALLLEFVQMGQRDWWKGEKPLDARVTSIFSRGLVALNRVGEQAKAREKKAPVVPAAPQKRKRGGASEKPEPKIRVLGRSDFRNMPWANGNGVTTQMALHPDDSTFPHNFIYRLSRASVTESGPFSKLPEIDRILVLLSGKGIYLKHVGEALIHDIHLQPFDPHFFSGDDETTGRLLDGPVVDFNIMTRRYQAEAVAEVLKVASSKVDYSVRSGAHYLLYAAQGGFTASVSGNRKKYSVSEGELLAVHELPSAEEKMRLTADGESATIIAVEIRLSEAVKPNQITVPAPLQSNPSQTVSPGNVSLPVGAGKMQDDGGPARNFVADPAPNDGSELASSLFSIVGVEETTGHSGVDFQIVGAASWDHPLPIPLPSRERVVGDRERGNSDKSPFRLVASPGMPRSVLTTSLFKVVR